MMNFLVSAFNGQARQFREELEKMALKQGFPPWSVQSNAAYETMQKPAITVVVALLNYAKYLGECLDSICSSDLYSIPGGIEVLIVADRSTDGSEQVAKEYIEKSSLPMCFIEKMLNTGLSGARNVGFEVARAPYVFVLDADNWIYPNCLSVMYKTLHDSDYAAVYGIIENFTEKNRKTVGTRSACEWDVQRLVRGPYIDAMAMLRRDVVLKLGGYQELLLVGWEDYNLWLQIARRGYTCKFIPQILCAYRLHSLAMSSTLPEYHYDLIRRELARKYSDLVSKFDDPILFGGPREHVLSDFKLRTENEGLRQENAMLKDLVLNMEESKFWKVRELWWKMKRKIMPDEFHKTRSRAPSLMK